MQRYLPFFIIILTFATACEENDDVTTPLGGYNVFKNALESGDGPLVWDRLSKDSHEFFEDKYKTLQSMDDTIVKYLPTTDHAIAKRQAGTVLLKKANGGKELFLEIFDGTALKKREEKQDWATELGEKGRATFAQIPGVHLPKISLSEDEKSAVVDAPGVQIAMLTRPKSDGKEEWVVDLVRSGNIVKQNFAWIDTNQEALTKTVDDLITDQRHEREKLIAELMGFDKTKGKIKKESKKPESKIVEKTPDEKSEKSAPKPSRKRRKHRR